MPRRCPRSRCHDRCRQSCRVSADVLATRFQAQFLGEQRGADAIEVCERLLAVQAQDLRCARLAIRARTSGLTVTDVDRRLNDGTLVIGWLNRGTLHLVRREDYWWLHALTTPPLFAANARRLAQTGVTAADAERGVALIERALGREGPLSRDQLRTRLDAARVPTAGQALVHLLMLACLRGIAVRGPLVDGRHAYVLTGQWLDPPRSVDRARGARRAGASLPDRACAGHRSRPGEVGGITAARRPGRPDRDSARARRARRRLARARGHRERRRAACLPA